MDIRIIIIVMIIMIPCLLGQSRIGYDALKLYEDNSGINWNYIYSNSTLIFDNLYKTTSGFNVYYPFILIEASNIPNFTLILKNENTIILDNAGDLVGVNALEFRGHWDHKFIIQGDGKLIIKVKYGKDHMYGASAIEILQCDFEIRGNAKIEIIMEEAYECNGIYILNGNLFMKENSILSIYIENLKSYSTGIDCDVINLSGNVTINSSIIDLSSQKSNKNKMYSGFSFDMNDYSNVTFISNGTLELPEDFFVYLGKDPIIINAIETLEEFKQSHKLTQKNENKSIIFSNYFTERNSVEENVSHFLKISFFILLNLILII